MSFTWPAFTWSTKNGLYGTRTREAGCMARELKKMFSARIASAKAIQRRPGSHPGRGRPGDDDPRGDGGAAPSRFVPSGGTGLRYRADERGAGFGRDPPEACRIPRHKPYPFDPR